MESFRCYLCIRAGRESGPRWNSRSLLCQFCGEWLRATGRTWCATGRHVVQGERRRCRDCERVRLRQVKGYISPPTDYVSLGVLADRLRTSPKTIYGWLKRGWAVHVARVGRHWYVPLLDQYPPIPDRRKPSQVRLTP